MNIPFIDLSWQESQIAEGRNRRFQRIITDTAFVLGKEVEEFEVQFAAYCGVKHAIGVANGTDALALIWRALELEPGDEVLLTPATFIASASSIIHAGLVPRFVDIDPRTRGFDFEKLERALTQRTKAILPVHLYGAPEHIDKVIAFAKQHGLLVVEDACQAHGAYYGAKRVGSFGIAAAFSFYPGKNLGAYGDAGAVVTNDDALTNRIRKTRNHGGIKKYEHEFLGYNSRLDALQAAVLIEKLAHLDNWNEMRRTIARQYREGLESVEGLMLPPPEYDDAGVHHLYVVGLPKYANRTAVQDALAKEGVATGIHYPDALHLLPVFADLGYSVGDFPAAEEHVQRILSLPIFPGMTEEMVGHVIESMKRYFENS